ncbi:MAG: hypothetical protein Kow0090_04050 [Myxococcota bacterium]
MYDFSLIFPPSVPEYQTALLFLLIMSFPLILGVGLLFTLGLILTISAIYSKPAERFLMAVCIFLLIAFVPIVNAGLFFIDRDYNQYGLSWRALHSPLTKSEIAELEDYYETNRGNAFAAAALAAIKKRGGNYGEAEKILVETLSSNHGMVFARANLANIFLVTNRIDKAIVEYEEAIKSGSADTYLYFNLAQVFYRKFEPSRGQEYLERARREDMKLTKFLEESHRESANRFVFDTAPCVNLFFSELFDALDFFAPAGETAAIEMLGSLPYKLNALILLGFFGIILIVPNFSKKLKFAKACTKCGAPSSLRDNPEMPNQELCGQCFHLYVTRQVVSPQARLKKDVAIKRHFLREHIYLLLCSLLPGAGHIYSGKPIGGGFMLILVSIILVLLFGDSLVPNSVVPGLTGKVALIIPSVIILIVLYIISFVNYQKEKA